MEKVVAGRSAHRWVMVPATLNSDHGHCIWLQEEKSSRIEAMLFLMSAGDYVCSCENPGDVWSSGPLFGVKMGRHI